MSAASSGKTSCANHSRSSDAFMTAPKRRPPASPRWSSDTPVIPRPSACLKEGSHKNYAYEDKERGENFECAAQKRRAACAARLRRRSYGRRETSGINRIDTAPSLVPQALRKGICQIPIRAGARELRTLPCMISRCSGRFRRGRFSQSFRPFCFPDGNIGPTKEGFKAYKGFSSLSSMFVVLHAKRRQIAPPPLRTSPGCFCRYPPRPMLMVANGP